MNENMVHHPDKPVPPQIPVWYQLANAINMMSSALVRERPHKVRAGVTKNHGQKRNKNRVRTEKESRRRNRK